LEAEMMKLPMAIAFLIGMLALLPTTAGAEHNGT